MNAWLDPLLSNAVVATVLALLVLGVAWFRPRPAVVHALWLIVLVKFVTPPVFRIELLSIRGGAGNGARIAALDDSSIDPLLRVNGTVDSSSLDGSSAARGAEQVELETMPIFEAQPIVDDSPLAHRWLVPSLLSIWLAGSLGWFTLAGIRLRQFYRQLRRTRPAGNDVQSAAREIAERLGLGKCPTVRVADARLPPMLTTLRGRGIVLLSNELLANLSSDQQSAILAHELAHYRRCDHWVRWLEFVVTGLYWWHPVAWLARRQLHNAEELCCDAWVVNVFPDRAKVYVHALMATVDFLSDVRTPALVCASGFGRAHSLQRRLEMILKRTWQPGLSKRSRMALLAAALVVLPCAPFVLSQSESTRLSSAETETTLARNEEASDGAVTMNDLKTIGLAYHLHCAAMHRSPASAEELAAYFGNDARLLGLLNGGQIRFVYEVEIADMPAGPSATIIAHEKDAAKEGGLVLMADGAARRMTAEEFKATTIAKPARTTEERLERMESKLNELLRRMEAGNRPSSFVAPTGAHADEAEPGAAAVSPDPDPIGSPTRRQTAFIAGAPEESGRPVTAAAFIAGGGEPVGPYSLDEFMLGLPVSSDQAMEARIQNLGLIEVYGMGTVIDTSRVIVFLGKRDNVEVRPGSSVFVELPKPTKTFYWHAGDAPEGVGDDELPVTFTHVWCRWDHDGKLTWQCYGPTELK